MNYDAKVQNLFNNNPPISRNLPIFAAVMKQILILSPVSMRVFPVNPSPTGPCGFVLMNI